MESPPAGVNGFRENDSTEADGGETAEESRAGPGPLAGRLLVVRTLRPDGMALRQTDFRSILNGLPKAWTKWCVRSHIFPISTSDECLPVPGFCIIRRIWKVASQGWPVAVGGSSVSRPELNVLAGCSRHKLPPVCSVCRSLTGLSIRAFRGGCTGAASGGFHLPVELSAVGVILQSVWQQSAACYS